ncbi:MAG: hypothetical protein GX607_23010 [Myxococcales bacterium]|jgi:hypothetical protein|nr:hypothetical protein [Myxococcales bacterium]
MPEMTPCSSCDRYVKANASTCPFCGAACTAAPSAARAPAPGLSRAAAFSIRAALATGAIAAAVACGDDDDDDKSNQVATGGQSTGGEASGGVASGGAALDTSPGGLGGGGFSPIAIYGGPFPDMVRAKV